MQTLQSMPWLSVPKRSHCTWFPAQKGFQHVAQEWMVKTLYTLTGYFSYSLSYNYLVPRFSLLPRSVRTGRTEPGKRGCSHRLNPSPHPTNNVGRTYAEFFFPSFNFVRGGRRKNCKKISKRIHFLWGNPEWQQNINTALLSQWL